MDAADIYCLGKPGWGFTNVYGRVLFWKFLLKMIKCNFIRFVKISCWKDSDDSNPN
jgi:hypothetical protein